MRKGMFYSVGVGPGDPELMSLKAVRTIKECDVIISPESGGKENLALEIAREYIAGKRIELCPMPMIRDKKMLGEYHDRAAARISILLDEGLSVAFLTIGDPSVYSTAMYVHERLTGLGYETRIIPGIPSFCAAAAALNISLCSGNEPLHIIPASYTGEYTELCGTKVLMKSGKGTDKLLAEIRETGEERAYMVLRASMEDERICRPGDEYSGGADYFSLIVVKPI